MFNRKGSYPIKINWEITSPEKLQAESDKRDQLWFSNQPVPEDLSDIIYIPYNRTEEFVQRYNELVDYFNYQSTQIDNEFHKNKK